MNIQGRSEWIRWLAGLALSSAVAGGGAAIGFYTTIHLRLSTIESRLSDVQSASIEQAERLRALEARQSGDDVVHARDIAIQQQLLEQLKEVRADVQFLQRDLIGRVRSPGP